MRLEVGRGKIHYNVGIIISIVLTIVCVVTVDVMLKHSVEESARVVARYNLQQVKTCVNDILLGTPDKMDYSKTITNDDIEKTLNTCARDVKITTSSDMFAYDMRTKMFVFDPSLDCFVEGGKYMTPESECQLHENKGICKQVLRIMDSGWDSNQDMKVSWQFNNGKEYLEWAILPGENIGFDGVSRGGVAKPQQILLAQGIVEDELWARYKMFRVVVYISGFLAIVVNLMFSVYDNMLHERDSRSRGDYK